MSQGGVFSVGQNNYFGDNESRVFTINLFRNLRGGVSQLNLGVNTGGTQGGGILNIDSDADTLDHLGDVTVGGSLTVNGTKDLYYLKNSSAYLDGTTVLHDTFIEAVNTDITSHAPDVGTGYTEVIRNAVPAGNYAIVSGGNGFMSSLTDTENGGLGYTVDDTPSTPDYEIRAIIRQQQSSDDIFWLMVRYQDSDNFYALSIGNTTAYFTLFKKVAGVVTTIANMPYYVNGSVSDNINVPVTLRVIGNKISVFYNDYYRGTYEDGDLTTAGQAGFGWGNLLQASPSTGYEVDDAWRISSLTVTEFDSYQTAGLNLGASAYLNWNSDTFLFRDSANVLAQRNDLNSQALRVYNTYTSASN